MASRSVSLWCLLVAAAVLGISTAALAGQSASSRHLSFEIPPVPPSAGPGQGGGTPPASANDEDDDDLSINLAQPDYTVITLPTTLRLPRNKSAFRVTHRFGRPLGQGTFGDLAGDFFGLDSGARIGLEYRYGLMRGTQVGVYRTNDKTIEFFGQYDAVRQKPGVPVTVDVLVSVDGTNNFRDEYSPALGAIVSRTVRDRVALYVEPIWVGNSNLFTASDARDNTVMIGLGARVRVRPAVYIVGAWTPRASGYRPGVSQKTFGIEKRVGGHSFQLNFSNSLGTTMGQIARGGGSNDDWYLGFNIMRKFF